MKCSKTGLAEFVASSGELWAAREQWPVAQKATTHARTDHIPSTKSSSMHQTTIVADKFAERMRPVSARLATDRATTTHRHQIIVGDPTNWPIRRFGARVRKSLYHYRADRCWPGNRAQSVSKRTDHHLSFDWCLPVGQLELIRAQVDRRAFIILSSTLGHI